VTGIGLTSANSASGAAANNTYGDLLMHERRPRSRPLVHRLPGGRGASSTTAAFGAIARSIAAMMNRR